MNLRPSIFGQAFIDCVQVAAEAQDRRVEREGVLISPRIPPADAHLCGFSRMDHEAHIAASRKGGQARCGANLTGVR